MAKLDNIAGFAPMENTVRSTLPAGQAFVCKIIGVKVEDQTYGRRLVFQIEIDEGEYKGFYKKDFDAQKGGQYEPKYKGVYRVNIPSDNSMHRDWDLRTFNAAFGAIESSNPGYRFADTMETNTLKGKLVGIVTREAEFNDVTFTEIGMFISADRARNGNFKPMKKRGGSAPSTNTAPVMSAFDGDEEDLPF